MIARRVRVTGRVQGVFFRAWTAEEARTLNVNGWVRNCSDGSVEAHVEGEPDAVDRLIDSIRAGPPGAQVDQVTVDTVESAGLSSFEVRH